MTIKQLRALAPTGYNLAIEVPANTDIRDMDVWDNACPVLAEAEGALGVLRALDLPGRRPGIQKRMVSEGGQHCLLHAVMSDPIVIHRYEFCLTLD